MRNVDCGDRKSTIDSVNFADYTDGEYARDCVRIVDCEDRESTMDLVNFADCEDREYTEVLMRLIFIPHRRRQTVGMPGFKEIFYHATKN